MQNGRAKQCDLVMECLPSKKDKTRLEEKQVWLPLQ